MGKKLKVVGSRFTKLNGEVNTEFSGKVSMDTNIKVISIELFKDKKDTIKAPYSFEIDYKDLGKVEIEGNLFLESDTKTIKDLVKSWKNKKFNTDEQITITNIILQKASIKAFELEEELGLPIHIKLPTLKAKE
jgi:RNase P/RNase MRP subunit p29|tara:strand:- start:115 stop:516 length:402 start_codon:yes stop_codon:yes gene_type:complete